ncbi:nitroreductase family protein [Holzapfeliella sp. He02]|uniref:Nitroreductase family protein n=1 Tax=Holzapfeliella saturejae TaxID=3082953 RepID=A0ABU8SEZ2_9LACO
MSEPSHHFLNLINKRTSIRKFQDKPLSKTHKEQITTASFNAPTTQFRQAGSIIEISDPVIKEQLAEISGQSYVANNGLLLVFIADEYRNTAIAQTNNQDHFMYQKPISLINAIVDTSLMAQNANLAAESLEIGSVYLGSILNDAQKVIELLKLPKYTFPLFAMAFGYPDDNPDVKPKLNHHHRLFQNSYDLNHINSTSFNEYDTDIKNYYTSRDSHNRTDSFISQIAQGGHLIQGKRLDIAKILKDQGFDWQ